MKLIFYLRVISHSFDMKGIPFIWPWNEEEVPASRYLEIQIHVSDRSLLRLMVRQQIVSDYC